MTEQELRDEFDILSIEQKIEWALDTIRHKENFGMDELNASLSRERRAKGVLLDCKETIKAKDAEIERLKSNFAGYENFQMEKQLKQELQKTREQLEKAESVIKFYADINNWTGEDINGWNCTNVIEPDDQETLETVWIKGCGTEKDIYDDCGGKRARQYFKDKQGE